MHLLRLVPPLAVLLTVTTAKSPIADPDFDDQPQPRVQPQLGTSLEGVAAGFLPPGPVALQQAYNKYRKPVPKAVVRAAAAATQSGTVQATNLAFDKAYLIPVTIGKAAKRYLLNPDTGSSDLWTFSTTMPQSQRGTHQLYGLGGAVQDGETWDISYGDGSGASGVVYADKVTIGGVTATVQAVEAATSVSSSFTKGEHDGLVGLGMDAGNTCYPYYCYTFMHQVAPTLPLPLFTSTLRKGRPGTYDFGYIDHGKYTGALSYVPIDHSYTGSSTFWEFRTGGYSIGSGVKKVLHSAAIADTGTSLALVDDAIVNDYYANVAGAHYNVTWGGVIFKCNAKLPALSFYWGGKKHTTNGVNTNYAALDLPGYCYGGVQSNAGMGFTILGDVFLKSLFVVFDYGNNRIGFAPQA